MSYDLYASEGGEELDVDHDSPTYNYGPMIRAADKLAGGQGCSFAAIDGVYGMKAEIWFRRVLQALVAHRHEIEPLQPANGWGTYTALVECFRSYAALAREHPRSHWRQSGDGGQYMRCCGGWYCGRADAGDELRRIVDETREEDGQECAQEGDAQVGQALGRLPQGAESDVSDLPDP